MPPTTPLACRGIDRARRCAAHTRVRDSAARRTRPAVKPRFLDWLCAVVFVLVGLGLYVGLELKRPITGLGNNDVAGIAYEADLIRAGWLPYRDSYEIKSPLAFFLVAIAWSIDRSAEMLHYACHAWIMLGAVGIAIGAWWSEIEASRALRVRLVGFAVFLYIVASAPFESNYTTWMMPPYAWAFACAMAGLRTGKLGWHVGAGAASALAFLAKSHAFLLGVAIPLAWLWVRLVDRKRGAQRANAWAWLGWVGGAMLGGLPLLLVYASRGATMHLVNGVLPFGTAKEYSARPVDLTAKELVVGIFEHHWDLMPALLATALASVFVVAVVLVLGFRSRNEPASAAGLEGAPHVSLFVPLLVFWLISIVGGGLGGLRYFAHYVPQYVPAMVWIGASSIPWRAVVELEPKLRRWGARGVLALAAVGCLFVGGERVVAGWNKKVGNGYGPGTSAKRAGEYIARRTEPEDRVQVFGWRGWPVYFYSNRLAPGRVYKALGTITEYNRNGRFPTSEKNRALAFKPGPAADELLAVFQTEPPAFVVRARPFFPGVTNDPLRSFKELEQILRRDYVLDRRFGTLSVYEHRAHRKARIGDDRPPTGRELAELEKLRTRWAGKPITGEPVDKEFKRKHESLLRGVVQVAREAGKVDDVDALVRVTPRCHTIRCTIEVCAPQSVIEPIATYLPQVESVSGPLWFEVGEIEPTGEARATKPPKTTPKNPKTPKQTPKPPEPSEPVDEAAEPRSCRAWLVGFVYDGIERGDLLVPGVTQAAGQAPTKVAPVDPTERGATKTTRE